MKNVIKSAVEPDHPDYARLMGDHWPSALRAGFEAARTVKPGKPTFRLALVSEE